MKTALFTLLLFAAPGLAFADPAESHDVPFASEDVSNVRIICSGPDRPDHPCQQIDRSSDAELLERLEHFRKICLDWIDFRPRFQRVVDTHGTFFYPMTELDIEAMCDVPPALRPIAYASPQHDPGYLSATLSRLERRTGNVERVEATTVELTEQLGRAAVSLELQKSGGQLDSKTYHEFREQIQRCSDHIEAGPTVMMYGEPFQPWEQTARTCVSRASNPVFERAREGAPADLRPMWIGYLVFLILSLVGLAIWNRRHARANGQFEIGRWATDIDELSGELQKLARDVESGRDTDELNAMLARVAALEQWVQHFGDDATKADVERSAKLSNIVKRNFTWHGFADAGPVASVSGHPEQLFQQIEKFLADDVEDAD